uniref:Uncharacterized protein n=1 Tax=Proboscia inermis TaxID=420281 RepID=A0A7S0G9V6_9STRA
MPFEVVKRTALDDDQNKQQQQGRYDDEDDFLTEQLLDQFLNEDDDDDYNKPRRYPEKKHKKKNYDIRKVTYKVASASQALNEGEAMGANVLIVDPPRKGLEEEVLHQLCQPINSRQKKTDNIEVLRDEDGYYDDEDDYDNANQNINLTNDVTTLIYVSCGFDALARDTTQLLSSNGGWELIRSTGYVLFPGSNHVETLAIFQRVDPRERGKRRQEKY